MKYLYDPPGILKRFFPNFVWNSKEDGILLTFDDGPTGRITEVILKKLADLDIGAVFFCVGTNVLKNMSLVGEIISEGHEIGNHTVNHAVLPKLSKRNAGLELSGFNTIMKEHFNRETKYFRPPRGLFGPGTSDLLESAGLTNVMWSLLTYDYKNDINIVKFAIKNFLRADSIVVLHDNVKCGSIIEASIDFLVEEADKKNFKFGNPFECLKYSS